MSNNIDTTGSVGIVQKKAVVLDGKISLECGRSIGPVTVAYETYGTLNRDKTNAILVCHALSGDAHAAGFHSRDDKAPGWWDTMIGPGKAFDTDSYYVISSNVLGGCKGTIGPVSVNPDTKKEWATDFPVVTIRDMVKVQKALIDYLGIKRLLAVSGGSMGGMQALEWSVSYPDSVSLVIPFAASARQSAQNIAFHEVGRKAIVNDPEWNNGRYYGSKGPQHGLAIARMIGHITYLSEGTMKERFGRKLQDKCTLGFTFDTEFQVESYLRYKGESFVERFDANTYLYITKAIDYFDLTQGDQKKLSDVFEACSSKFLIISYSSDWLYTTAQSREIVQALQLAGKDVISYEVKSDYGHDSFLLKNSEHEQLVKDFLRNNHDRR